MHEGRLLVDARPGAIPELLPGAIVEITTADRAAATAALGECREVVDVAVFGAALHARVEGAADPEAVVRRALASRDVAGATLRSIRPGLEDAFLFLTRSDAGRPAQEAT